MSISTLSAAAQVAADTGMDALQARRHVASAHALRGPGQQRERAATVFAALHAARLMSAAEVPSDLAQHPDPCGCPRCVGLEPCPSCGRVKLDADWCFAERRLVLGSPIDGVQLERAQLTPGLWRAQHWTRHAATTVMVDDPDANTLGVRLVAECETEADARLMAAAKPMLDIIERLEEAFTRQGWRLDGHSPESAMLRDCRAALAIVRGSPT